jgi:hypothetical protein
VPSRIGRGSASQQPENQQAIAQHQHLSLISAWLSSVGPVRPICAANSELLLPSQRTSRASRGDCSRRSPKPAMAAFGSNTVCSTAGPTELAAAMLLGARLRKASQRAASKQQAGGRSPQRRRPAAPPAAQAPHQQQSTIVSRLAAPGPTNPAHRRQRASEQLSFAAHTWAGIPLGSSLNCTTQQQQHRSESERLSCRPV